MTYDVDIGDVTRDIHLDVDCDLSEAITSSGKGSLEADGYLLVALDILALVFGMGFSIQRILF